MTHYCFVVISNPVAGQEEEYNRWYTDQHLPDVLAIPGIVGAQRFKLAQPKSDLPGGYLALYDIETNDPQAVMAELERRSGTPQMVMSEALDMSRISATLFSAMTTKLSAAV